MTDPLAPPTRFAGSEAQLHDAAAALIEGWADFGADDYRRGLEVLLHSMDYDPRWSEDGRRRGWMGLASVLAARGHAVRAMAQTPGWNAHAITAPIIITGLPRTGTTALHKLLAVDPQFQGLQTWITSAPQPRPPRDTWEANPRFQRSVAELEARHREKPAALAAHAMAAEEVDECCLILRQGFVSNLFTCGWSAQSYDLWRREQSEAHCYAHFERVLRLVGSNEPDKRWLLKNPGHIESLDALFAQFPDARVIQTHRDPAKAIPSLCALLIGNHALFEEGRIEERAWQMGLAETEKWARAIGRAEPVREAHASQVLDVIHTDFHRDPMGTVEQVYAFAGLELSDKVRADMAVRIEEKPELAHGPHRYSLEDFGLSAGLVREIFGDYVERFDLLEKRA
ncbi:sulfotransferase [Novosphingobium aquae]|uniref:Sulfotransferase n=1 Tax=Novosphingobium aquae TaxID=3133435 RepID=A0ABU8SDW7_9SPHN